ncbi:Hypothetical protein NTJ_09324 [Nesidiocoris tenuis]|uniref:Uncharacterized protein n=1 Tax=Nesidiocoris tenuis TaxID=355587 RepID=A0ABN7AWY0_9HEMI|nr:Hypothetical protein NTJ_09324 [Nesidiocoris tenuis]
MGLIDFSEMASVGIRANYRARYLPHSHSFGHKPVSAFTSWCNVTSSFCQANFLISTSRLLESSYADRRQRDFLDCGTSEFGEFAVRIVDLDRKTQTFPSSSHPDSTISCHPQNEWSVVVGQLFYFRWRTNRRCYSSTVDKQISLG